MDKRKKKYFIIFIFAILCIIILHTNFVFAGTITNDKGTYTYKDTDDGTDGPDVNNIRFHITFYGAPGEPTLCGATLDQFTHKNEKHKWNEIEIDGEYYAVIAGATHFMLKQPETASGYRWFWSKKFNHIHYFKTETNMNPKDCEKIEFKFEDQSFDSNVYKGVILDTGGPQMFPQDDEYSGFEPDTNILDFYYEDSESGNQPPEADAVNGKIILVSMDGSFKTTKSSDEDLTFLEKIGGNLAKFHNFIGDLFQIFLDKKGTDLTAQEAKRLLYDKNDLKSSSNKFYKEIQVADSTETIETKTLKSEPISNTIENQDGQKEEVFNKNTKIPVIPIDVYSMVATDIKILDIDFLSNNKQNDNKLWNLYRNVISVTSHSVLYICTALIIGIIIYRSILLVMSSYTSNPTVAEQSKKIINNLVKGVIYIVAVYLIIAIMINFYKLVISAITTDNASKYIIRLDVDQVYSFNTNIIGGAKYLAQSTNVAMSYGWSWAYLGMALLDFFWFFIMLVRTFAIGIFVITAPITAIVKINETDTKDRRGFFYIGNWMKAFLIILWLPFPVAGLLSLLLHI